VTLLPGSAKYAWTTPLSQLSPPAATCTAGSACTDGWRMSGTLAPPARLASHAASWCPSTPVAGRGRLGMMRACQPAPPSPALKHPPRVATPGQPLKSSLACAWLTAACAALEQHMPFTPSPCFSPYPLSPPCSGFGFFPALVVNLWANSQTGRPPGTQTHAAALMAERASFVVGMLLLTFLLFG